MVFSPGGRVMARGLTWDVIGVEMLGRQQLLHLRCSAGDLRGLPWDILVPYETVTSLPEAFRPEEVQPLEIWRLHHIASLVEQLPGPSVLAAGVPFGVAVEPYQLVPLLRAVGMSRPRLLLADGVGLGKTIQAGLIANELLARRRAHRILVVAPAGPLLRQWHQELRHRFGLRFTMISEAATLSAERRRLELGGNPFDAAALCLTSIDFAKQERVLEELERTAWDLVIIDEAHHCVGAPDTAATQRRRLAEVLARQSDGLLLLTATPHDGHDAHFGSLLSLLDPSLVDAGGLPLGMAYRSHVVRRLKRHVRDSDGQPLFRERRVLPVAVKVHHPAIRSFHAALSGLIMPRLGRAGSEALAFVSLLKRSVSSLAACVSTLRVVAERLGANDPAAARERTRALRAYRRKLERYGTLDATDEAELAELEAEDVAARLRAEEAAALHRLIGLGEAAAPHDPKLLALVAQIQAIRAERPAANVLVYTEYADTQAAALVALKASGLSGEILAISGQDKEDARSAAAERCTQADDVILVTTDSLAEGLNLQRRCRDLIHLDLPYNPNRLEQRNGRIDRYGQREQPLIRYLYLVGTFEEQLLLRLIGKYEKARAALTVMPDTLGVTADPSDLEPALLEGFAERQASLFEEAAPVIRTLDHTADRLELESYRALRQEIDRAYEGFERMAVRHGWLPDQGIEAETSQLTDAFKAHRRGERLRGGAHLAAFVREAVTADQAQDELPRVRLPEARGRSFAPITGSTAPLTLKLPDSWISGLDGLPGYDPTLRTLSLEGLGRGHPVVERAITRMRQATPVVAEVVGQCGGPSLLLTYTAELHGPEGLAWQRVLAVRLERGFPPEVTEDPTQWLNFGAALRGRRPTPSEQAIRVNEHGQAHARSMWSRHFAWAQTRLPEAETAALGIASSLARTFLSERRSRAKQDDLALREWLRRRANDLCGVSQAPTPDLFKAGPPALDWRSETEPTRRLALYAADTDTPPGCRQVANELLGVLEERLRQANRRTTLGAPVLRPLGMLMRVP